MSKQARIDQHNEKLWSQSLRSDIYVPQRPALKVVTNVVAPVDNKGNKGPNKEDQLRLKLQQRAEQALKLKQDRAKVHAPMVR